MEDRPPYDTGPIDNAEPPLATEDLIALAHAQRQDIPYETREQLPGRLHDLADLVLGKKMQTGDIAYALAALIDNIENAPGDAHRAH
ncbi:MAG TPA: hypothetical protein PLD30_17085 [Candidatus Competibacteraceae bacterium]|nr:hypothetical protein [Candidatus Competibacteraceae bacterium]